MRPPSSADDDATAAARSRDDAGHAAVLGAQAYARGCFEQALALFERAAAADPGALDARRGAIAALCRVGRAAEAGARCAALAAAFPDIAEVRLDAGLVHEALGDAAAALRSYDEALALAPDLRPALLNRGRLLAQIGRLEDAHAASTASAAAFPDEPVWHVNAAETALALSRYDEAVTCYGRALALDRALVPAHLGRALALAALGRIDEAQAAFAAGEAVDREAMLALWQRPFGRASAEPFDAREVYLVRAFEALDRCDWSGRDAAAARAAAWFAPAAPAPPAGVPLAFRALAMGFPAALRRRVAEAVSARVAASTRPARSRPRARRDRLRIGYVSPDFGEHAVGVIVQRLFGAHDRRQAEVFCYALSPHDGSAARDAVDRGADVVRDLSRAANDEAVARIRADGIDVLVDLAGYTTGARPALFAARPAPVAMSYLGFPGTTGARFIDYLVADAVVAPPPDAALYTEQVVRLPHTFWVYDGPPVAPKPERHELGLPDSALVLCAFHNGYKIGPDTFDAWMAILRAVPAAVLWLLDGGTAQCARLRAAAAAHGVTADRLAFAPRVARAANLARIASADLFVDALHYNAGANALDALWTGLPVLTTSGEGFAGRMAASAVIAAGHADQVAATPEQFVQRGIELLRSTTLLQELRNRLALDRRGPLFDVAARARELEAAYATAAERARQGLAPAAVDVSTSRPAGAGGPTA